ncbi:MAG: hypothetical protein RMY31_007035 [Dendronalium sp. ChiSLP03b]
MSNFKWMIYFLKFSKNYIAANLVNFLPSVLLDFIGEFIYVKDVEFALCRVIDKKLGDV